MTGGYLELAERIRGEVPELQRVVDRALAAWTQVQRMPQEDAYLDSVALNLHSLYSGLEQFRDDWVLRSMAEPVFRFEALKGRIVLQRDEETWLRFFSVTCREYEAQMFHYVRQRRYRLQAAAER